MLRDMEEARGWLHRASDQSVASLGDATETREALVGFQPAAKATRLNRRKRISTFTGRRRAFVLLRQVQSLVGWRRRQGVVFDARDERQFVWVLAQLLVTTTPSFEELQRPNRLQDDDPRHGLDYCTLTRAMKDAGLVSLCKDELQLGSLCEDEIMSIIHGVQAWHDAHPNCLISGKAVGKALGLSATERYEVRCWNILPIDESEQQRLEKRKEKKREADREWARQKREGKHVPRSEYLAQAERRRAFCQKHGITERTLSRWIAKNDPRVRSLSHSDISSNHEATDFGHLLQRSRSVPFAGPYEGLRAKRALSPNQRRSGAIGGASTPKEKVFAKLSSRKRK